MALIRNKVTQDIARRHGFTDGIFGRDLHLVDRSLSRKNIAYLSGYIDGKCAQAKTSTQAEAE